MFFREWEGAAGSEQSPAAAGQPCCAWRRAPDSRRSRGRCLWTHELGAECLPLPRGSGPPSLWFCFHVQCFLPALPGAEPVLDRGAALAGGGSGQPCLPAVVGGFASRAGTGLDEPLSSPGVPTAVILLALVRRSRTGGRCGGSGTSIRPAPAPRGLAASHRCRTGLPPRGFPCIALPASHPQPLHLCVCGLGRASRG